MQGFGNVWAGGGTEFAANKGRDCTAPALMPATVTLLSLRQGCMHSCTCTAAAFTVNNHRPWAIVLLQEKDSGRTIDWRIVIQYRVAGATR